MKSVMEHSFSQVPRADIERSNFNRSHGHKTTFDAGYLIPVYLDDVLPGDTFNLQMSCLARLATPIKPVMDNMFLDSFFFFVPLRLIWDNFPKFFGEQRNPTDSTSYVTPKMTTPAGGFTALSIHDYFGLPVGISGLDNVNVLFHRAYNLIWNEWFRDQNLQVSVNVPVSDGPDIELNYTLLRRGKRHDYFTSCLPWPQKNNTGVAVTLPLGSSATVRTSTSQLVTGAQYGMSMRRADTGAQPVSDAIMITESINGRATSAVATSGSSGVHLYPSNLYADLSAATASTINQIREAFQIQRLYERDARGGSRYTEIIRSHFGVVSPDARLQRPEYLGGGSSMINVTPVPQNAITGTTPQGNLAGFGVASSGGSDHSFVKSFTEHGVIIGMVSVRADLTYQTGVHRMFSRSTRFDYFWPALAHLGEQAVLNKEIYAQGITATDNAVFGYQERYAEYRYKPSLITGEFRSDHAGSLDVWHLSQDFTALPVLNSAFIEENPPIDRVIAVPAEPHFLFDSYFYLNCVRPMPTYAVPGMIDHF